MSSPQGQYPQQPYQAPYVPGQHQQPTPGMYQPQLPPYVQAVVIYRNPIATAAMVMGIIGTGLAATIIGLFVCFVPAVLAIIFGFIGLSKAKQLGGLKRTSALTGVIMGFVPGAIFIGVLIVGAISQGVSQS